MEGKTIVPGDVLGDGVLKYLVCPILNDTKINALVPMVCVDMVKSRTGITPVWPLGVFLIFTDEGITLGIFGSRPDETLGFELSDLDLEEDKAPEGLAPLWEQWKKLRDSPTEVALENLERMATISEAQYRGAS
jgi:hypothetical protein